MGNGVLLAAIILTLGAYIPTSVQTVTSPVAGNSWALTNDTGVIATQTSPIPDFTITATPASAIADGTTVAVSIIAINPLGGFNGSVTLSANPLPSGLTCHAFNPANVTTSGQSMLSCISTTPGLYSVAITGTSGSLTETATVTFTFLAPPDFAISATNPVSFTSGSTATSTLSVKFVNGFSHPVSLSATVNPSSGLSVSLDPQNLQYGSGPSTATFTSSTPGSYTVTITGAYGSLSHYTKVQVTVTSPSTPDFSVSENPSSLTIQAGSSGASTISISPTNSFTGSVTLSATVSPTGPTTTFSDSTISGGSGTSTLNVDVGSGVATGTYIVTVQATSGDLAHPKQLTVTVTSVLDITLTTSPSSFSFNSGSSGTATITVTAQNHFAGTIRLAVTAPSSVSCQVSSATIQSSGTSTLTCSGSTAGDYTITIAANGGASPHTTNVTVHVNAISPAAPAPKTIVGLAPVIFFSVIGVLIVALIAGATLLLRKSKKVKTQSFCNTPNNHQPSKR